MSEDISNAISSVSSLFSSAPTDTVGAFGNGAQAASDAAASNIAGAVPDATSAIPAASSASIPLGSAGGAFSSTDLTGSQPVNLGGDVSNLAASIAPLTSGGTTSVGGLPDLSAGPTAGLTSSLGTAPSLAPAGAAPTFAATAAPATAGIAGGAQGVAGLGNGLGDTGGAVDLTGGYTPTSIGDMVAGGKPSVPDATGVSAGGGGDFMKTLVGNNGLLGLAGPAVSALGLGMAAQKGNQAVPQTNNLNGIAQGLMKQGETVTGAATPLINALNTNTLPAGAQAALDQAAAAEKAHIRSTYAGMGLQGSTMEMQALQQVDQAIEAQKFDQMQKLVQQGISLVNAGTGESNTAAQIYQALQRSQMATDAALGTSISNFASALAGQPARGQQTQPQ